MLHLHRAERTGELAAELAAILARPLPDPFAPEVVAVPTRGVERWLAQRLSHILGASAEQDGVCANVLFPSPGELVAGVLDAVDPPPDAGDPWTLGASTWTLLGVIDSSLGEPWCTVLTRHLEPDEGGVRTPGRRFATAYKLARLFDSYAANRPGLLRAWASGADTDDADGRPLGDLAWQAELWRRLRAEIGVPSRPERLPATCARLRERPDIVDLPGRISWFGPTRLATVDLEVLAALAEHRDVYLWLPHPSPTLWDRVRALGPLPARPRRHEDPSAQAPRTPLVASLANDARELQVLLEACPGPRSDDYHPTPPWPDTLLGRLQSSVAADVEPVEPAVIEAADRSIQVHACHGPARQVEVLRDVLVGLLADDPTLEARDVIVMCPDIESYAPLISAAFGTTDAPAETHPGHRLRVRLADRSLRQTNPLLGLLAGLLEIAGGRLTASQVLDLAAHLPVRRRFRFSDDDLELLRDWVPRSGVRWGLDGEHRRPFHLGIPENTWSTGLDRILLGVAMAEDELRWVDRALPLDDVDSTDVDLAGRFAEFIDRLRLITIRLTGGAPLEGWIATLASALELLADVPDDASWQLTQADLILAKLATDAGPYGAQVELSLGDVQALFADRLGARPTRANFRTGHLTMCSMHPMRSVPHRVVCLLGLDDGSFPRGSGVDGDDLLARDPLVGDRDSRSEDRQLLLDAIMAAREHLVLFYTGADPRTNLPQPPAVPVGEILDALDVLAESDDGRSIRERVVVHHPLQPFDQRNFTPDALGRPGPFSFDRVALAGARRSVEPRVAVAGFLDGGPLPAFAETEVSLDALIRFFENPAAGLLRQRLGVYLPGEGDEVRDDLSVELSSLQEWSVGDRILQARLSGASVAACRQAEWRRGDLPPRGLGARLLDEIVGRVEELVTGCAAYLCTEAQAVDVVVDCDGVRVSGTVGNVRDRAVFRASYSRLAAKQRIRAWLQLLAITAARPETQWTAVTIGRGLRDGGPRRSTLGPLDPSTARDTLADLVRLRADGLCRPLPMPARTSAAFAEKLAGGLEHDQAIEAVKGEWSGPYGESSDPACQRVWGEDAGIDALLAEPPERAGNSTRFAEVAIRLWGALLAAEQVDAP